MSDVIEERDALRVLVVDDEEHLAAGLKLNFELEGMHVDMTKNTQNANGLLLGPLPFDVIVLDVQLPDVSGFEFCRRLRDAGNLTPVIMLTVRDEADDRVEGLTSGADDYLVKPFVFRELLARVRSLARRRAWERVRPRPARQLVFGAVEVDFDTHEVMVSGASVSLTRLELDLLRFLSNEPGRVRTREELLRHVWKLADYPNTRTVDNFIMRLRKHFEPNPGSPIYFISVRGAGYKFVG